MKINYTISYDYDSAMPRGKRCIAKTRVPFGPLEMKSLSACAADYHAATAELMEQVREVAKMPPDREVEYDVTL
jgi:hypothetical protein